MAQLPIPVSNNSTKTLTSLINLTQSTAPTQLQQKTTAAAAEAIRCHACQQESSHLRCSRCKWVYYCSKECQNADWPTHQPNCTPLDQQDKIGLTRLHYAVLNQEKIPKSLLPSLTKVKDSFGGIPADLQRLMKEPMSPDSETAVCQFCDKNGKLRPLTQREFFSRTHKIWTDWFHATPEKILEMHREFHGQCKPLSATLASALFAFEKYPPELELYEDPKLGYGVKAREDILADSIACFYVGEICGDSASNTIASQQTFFDPVDAGHITGIGPFINDGPVNCFFFTVEGYKGLPKIVAVFATRDIKKGETLRVNYGRFHEIKEGLYHIDPNSFGEVIQFCKAGLFYETENELNDPNALLKSTHV